MEECWVGANLTATFGGAGPQFGAWVPGQVIPAGFNRVGSLEPLARADPSARFSGAGLSGVVVLLDQSKQHYQDSVQKWCPPCLCPWTEFQQTVVPPADTLQLANESSLHMV